MWNSRPIIVLIRPSVHRWSAANPCASGPFPSSDSSRAHCRALSRSADTGPRDRSAPVPPSSQARCHRRTDPGVTRKSCAIWRSFNLVKRADAQCELQLEPPVGIAQLVAEQFADLPHPVPDRLRVHV